LLLYGLEWEVCSCRSARRCAEAGALISLSPDLAAANDDDENDEPAPALPPLLLYLDGMVMLEEEAATLSPIEAERPLLAAAAVAAAI
jgi:hypothetical protein